MKTPKPWRRKKPASGLVAEAARTPGGWVYEIDQDWLDDPDGDVPPEAIRGGWKVDDAGRITGEFVPNDKHSPPCDDFSALTDPDHWLGWLGDDPGQTVRDSIELTLADQVEGAKVQWLRFTDEPEFLTGGKPFPDDPNRIQVVRTGLAVQFILAVVQPSGQREVLTGVFSLAVAGMDEPEARERSWFDLGATMEQIRPLLKDRLFELDQAT
ncbi:hypothetical protein [Streptomyces sp. SID13031]|uniref:hypothetical protein n=1 Tax=Streptomyces sp. SID13031 TaxID=2706046 RepID=UPI0013CCA6AA|nr:hypothetical protein [Streptomyces sp. SID13031]NEA37135.1 hypothetical protein [Streptomyces sp. SID13031]